VIAAGLAGTGLAGRDDADAVRGAFGPHHEQDARQEIPAQREETRLARGIRVLDGEVGRVLQRADGVGEIDVVLAQILLALDVLSLVVHGANVCTTCIFVKAPRSHRLETPRAASNRII